MMMIGAHLLLPRPAAVAYSRQDPYIAYRATARMSIRTQAPTPFLSEEVAERVLALPTPPPSPLSPYSSPLPHIPSPPLPIPSPISPTYVEGSLGSRAAGILTERWHYHHHVMILRFLRIVFAAGTYSGLTTTARQTYNGFADTLEVAPGPPRLSKSLGYGIRDTWISLLAIQEISPTTLMGRSAGGRRPTYHVPLGTIDDAGDQMHSEGILLRTIRYYPHLRSSSYGQQPEETYSEFRAAKNRLSEAEGSSRDPKDSEEPQGSDDASYETTSVKYYGLFPASRLYRSFVLTSYSDCKIGKNATVTESCNLSRLHEMSTLILFKGYRLRVAHLTQWFERMETVFRISNCTVENQVKFATCTLMGTALTWWNSHARTVTNDVAYAMTWSDLKKEMTTKYCPRNEIKKIETELWNLKFGGCPTRLTQVLWHQSQRHAGAIEVWQLVLMERRNNTLAENKRKFEDTPRNIQTYAAEQKAEYRPGFNAGREW
ncbi:reverse transcriptase domain-containing protein [Tanacetum coccineum]|uniref:Reverse transcriptase domain-containing protein n=1 Tax=Tanacetum coccineum TaxID=301880 RepID=A0ABQ5FVJ7_9ASTR